MDVEEVLIRALKTFVQTFLATLAASVAGMVDIDTARVAVIAAAAAGLSAAWNAIVNHESVK